MSFKFHKKAEESRISDPGFGEKIGGSTKRVINKDGSFNVNRVGASGGLRNVYQFLLELSNVKFFLLIIACYVVINLFFAGLYYLNGTDNLIGVRGETLMSHYLNCFYFSTQTFTTVGYGSIAPSGIVASTIASFEALIGLLSFALATGLLFARFSKPKAKLLFSENILISPFEDGKAMMFRLVNTRTNVLMEMQAKVILMFSASPTDKQTRRYFELKLEIDKVLFAALSWTLVHKINEESPLFGLSKQDLIDLDAEVMILITAYDDTFNQVVHSRFSYVSHEFVWDAKFRKAFRVDEGGNVIMQLEDIHLFDDVISQ